MANSSVLANLNSYLHDLLRMSGLDAGKILLKSFNVRMFDTCVLKRSEEDS